MQLHRSLVRPEPAPRTGRLRRLRDWLLEDHLGAPTRADRIVIATLLRFGPPH